MNASFSPSTHDQATRLQALFTSPEKWTQKYQARDENGIMVSSSASDAVCWCMLGGMVKVAREADVQMPPHISDTELHQLLLDIIRERGVSTIGIPDDCAVFQWNDDPRRSFSEVKDVIDEAVKRTAPKETV